MSKAVITPLPLFVETFATMVVKNPQITKTLKTFTDFKSERPPIPLPRGMRDHKLTGVLEGLLECHLAGDACLIYTDRKGIVTLIAVVGHDEMQGSKARALAKRIHQSLAK